MKEPNWQFLPSEEWNPDHIISLKDLIQILIKLQKRYGKRALIDLDAGANNISAIIEPTKKNVRTLLRPMKNKRN